MKRSKYFNFANESFRDHNIDQKQKKEKENKN